MNVRHLPSIEALTANDDARLHAELRMSEVREQVTSAKELLERVEHLVRVSEHGIPSIGEPAELEARNERTLMEVARLGCRMLELASALTETRAVPPPPQSAPYPIAG